MALLLSLPNESLTTVFAYLPPPALAALVRVSRRLQLLAERLLYSTIVISEPTFACCAAVARRPHLAACIRRLAVRWSRDRAAAHLPYRLAPHVAPALRALLHAAPHIDALELHLAGFPAAPSCAPSPPSSTSTSPTTAARSCLAPHDLPRLASFRGDARCAAALLPGRPVSALALSGHEPTAPVLRACACSSRPIRRLDLSALSVTPTQLLTISKHLTALEILRMRLALRHTLHFTFSGMMLLSALTQVLGAFQSLAQLDLSPTSVDGIVGVHNEVEELSLCTAWAGVCPSLRRVKVPLRHRLGMRA
ncbi:hypothetical protein DFH11DRAFT_1690543 [Phellopilus nigrolimitatus]|nr:hypothetical protein DFH11DRAFT_1690543 [Phellopilus nigrolimitatus]